MDYEFTVRLHVEDPIEFQREIAAHNELVDKGFATGSLSDRPEDNTGQILPDDGRPHFEPAQVRLVRKGSTFECWINGSPVLTRGVKVKFRRTEHGTAMMPVVQVNLVIMDPRDLVIE